MSRPSRFARRAALVFILLQLASTSARVPTNGTAVPDAGGGGDVDPLDVVPAVPDTGDGGDAVPAVTDSGGGGDAAYSGDGVPTVSSAAGDDGDIILTTDQQSAADVANFKLEYNTFTIITFVCIALALIVASASGIGGGGILVRRLAYSLCPSLLTHPPSYTPPNPCRSPSTF